MSCSRSPELWEFNGETMGTTYTVKIVSDASVEVSKEDVNTMIGQMLDAFNRRMSTYIADSELSKINQAETRTDIPLSAAMEAVLLVSQDVFENSNGAFDVTVGPLVNLWGFGPEPREGVPSEVDIDIARVRVNQKYLKLKEKRLRKLSATYIDLSAVAKGYSTDVLSEVLDAMGFKNYMIEVGGELKLKGKNLEDSTWTIGIEKPTTGRTGAMQAITGDGIAIATSGDYRNYYEKDGKRVSHTIDPISGYPIAHKLASVTVVTKFGAYADAYATALNVLGEEKGWTLANDLELAAFFVIKTDDGFDVKHTPSFEQYMVQ